MNDEYEIIYVVGEGRAVKDNKTGKIYYSEFQIIEELKEELQRKDNIINELKNGIKELDNMFYETFRISQDGYFSISEWELKDFTDKIKELEKM